MLKQRQVARLFRQDTDYLQTWPLPLKYIYTACQVFVLSSSASARTEWAAERRRLKEQTAQLEEAEQKAKDSLLRAMANSSQVYSFV